VAPIAPAQPYSRVAGATFPPLIVTAYIRNDGCEGIALRSTAGGAVEPNCSDGAASLPSFISVNGNVTLLLAHYAAPVAAACDAVRPAPLMLRLVDNANTPAPVVTIPYALTPASASVRPAAFVALLGAVLIAAPDEATGLGLWVFDPSTLPGLLTPRKLDTGVTLVGARSLDVAVGTLSDAGQAPIAIVAESGCPPRQGVWVAAGTLTHNMSHIPTSVQLQRPVQIATGGTSDASPSVAWVSLPYDEWRVTWVVDGHTYFQRFTPEGMAIQGPIEVGGTISAAVAAYGSHDDVLEATSPAVDGNVYSVKLGCPK